MEGIVPRMSNRAKERLVGRAGAHVIDYRVTPGRVAVLDGRGP
jgi:hypothetical protein